MSIRYLFLRLYPVASGFIFTYGIGVPVKRIEESLLESIGRQYNLASNIK